MHAPSCYVSINFSIYVIAVIDAAEPRGMFEEDTSMYRRYKYIYI